MDDIFKALEHHFTFRLVVVEFKKLDEIVIPDPCLCRRAKKCPKCQEHSLLDKFRSQYSFCVTVFCHDHSKSMAVTVPLIRKDCVIMSMGM